MSIYYHIHFPSKTDPQLHQEKKIHFVSLCHILDSIQFTNNT